MATRYSIDLDWLEQNNRSFAALATSRLCAQSHASLQTSPEKALKASKLLEAFQQCCAQSQDFITATQPVMESLFRLFLATGNQPLSLEEISQELGHRRGGRPPKPQMLERLLDSDAFYGLRRLAESAPGEETTK